VFRKFSYEFHILYVHQIQNMNEGDR